MEYVASALAGVLLFLTGAIVGIKIRPPEPVQEPEEQPVTNLKVSALDSKRERRRKLEEQYNNLFSYNGEAQR